MWPNRRMEQYLSPIRDLQEGDRIHGQPLTTSTPQRSRHNNFRGYTDDDTESDDEAFHGSDAPVDLLLFTSIEAYVSVQSTEMASTSCTRPSSPYPHLMYYPTPHQRTSTPERNVQPIQQIEDDDILSISEDRTLTEDNVSLSSTLSTFTQDLTIGSDSNVSTELPMQRPAKRNTTILRKYVPTPEPKIARRRLRSVPKMPQPNVLAAQVANRVIKYARCIKNMHEKDMCCPNCGLLPICPVTGQCGHTRCTRCIQDKKTCPCGDDPPETLHVNILIRDLIGKTTSDVQCSRMLSVASSNVTTDDNPAGVSTDTTEIPDQPSSGPAGSCSGLIQQKSKTQGCNKSPSRCYPRIPMSPQARYNHALELLQAGRYREAAPHLALATASGKPDLRPARTLLAQVIMVLSKNHDPRSLTRILNRLVRDVCSTSWIRPSDVECILCCDTFTNPVTTPCGHMFCRICLERTLDYKKRCPLCLRPLNDFKITETCDTAFMQAALRSINAVNVPPPPEPDLIPIFVCTVAYPSVPCPLFIFDPRYWLMIRRVLESGSRKFGMVACDRDQNYADYGTILEVRDCVHLEDGRSILSTIGLSRFKVIERSVRDGCEVARILPIKDVTPVDDMEVWELKVLGTQIMIKALWWLSRLNDKVLADIEAAFGTLPPRGGTNEDWWVSTDGPTWLWWLVAVLPLRSEIKILILSTDCLLKRMMAVSRTLEAVDQVTLTTTTECEIPNSPAPNEHTMEGGS